MSDALRYAVALKGPPLPAPAALAKALAPVWGQPRQDLLAPMRRSWGLVELDCDETRARDVVSALAAAGIEAVAVPISLVEEPPPAEPARSLDLLQGDARLVCAAVYRATFSRVVTEEHGPTTGERAIKLGLSLATGLPLGLMGGAKRVVQKTVESSDLSYFLDLYDESEGQTLRRRRVDAQDFDYSCLGQRKGYDAAGNFRRLLEMLAARAGGLNAGARGLLDGKPVRELGYETAADLDREGRWLLTLAALKLL